jgi:ribulose-bisphosphate carboxylase large chain
MRAVAAAMKRAQDETGEVKLFSANITADDPFEMIARGEAILDIFGENASHVAFLVDGYVAGATAITTCRRYFPAQFLHYHRAGHGAVTSPQAKRGYTAFVHCKMSRMQGASGIHTGTMGYGKMEGEASDKAIAYMLERDVAEGPYYTQDWLGLKATTAIISGGMNALRLPGFFDNLGHSNVIQTSGGGAFGHKDGGAAGAKSLRQAHDAWMAGVDLVDYAKDHAELRGAFESFSWDADKLYPGWRNKLGIKAA